MEKNRKNLVRWALKKAEEYLGSAKDNLEKGRFFPCAEDIFKAVETLLEALLYHYGIKKIEYPGIEKKFKGRLALQFLVRDMLLLRKRIDRAIYDRYLALASELHLASYRPTKTFEKSELEEHLKFAENLFFMVKSMVKI
jgi:HEPN domain-containing protein